MSSTTNETIIDEEWTAANWVSVILLVIMMVAVLVVGCVGGILGYRNNKKTNGKILDPPNNA